MALYKLLYYYYYYYYYYYPKGRLFSLYSVVRTEEDQYSVVPVSDIMGENVKEGDVAIVAWRVVSKTRKISTSWYKAKVLKYSGEFNSFKLLNF